jgi:uncharacterized protein (DUF697 family)
MFNPHKALTEFGHGAQAGAQAKNQRGAATGAPSLPEWEFVPHSDKDIAAVIAQCKRSVSRRAALSAGASMLPIPGLDIAADVALLTQLIHEINQAFGLSQAQIEKLSHSKRIVVYQAITAIGGAMVGKLITRELVLAALRAVGVRLTTKQVAKYVPIAGTAAAAVLGYSAMRYVGNQHIKQCAEIARGLQQHTALATI